MWENIIDLDLYACSTQTLRWKKWIKMHVYCLLSVITLTQQQQQQKRLCKTKKVNLNWF